MQVKVLPSRRPLTQTVKLFSRRTAAMRTMTVWGIFTVSTPRASSMAQVRRSLSGMVSSKLGSAMVSTTLR